MHFFRRSFLEAVALRLHNEARFHIARKVIPSVGGPVSVSPALWAGFHMAKMQR